MLKKVLWGAGAIVLVLVLFVIGRTIVIGAGGGGGARSDAQAALPAVDIDRAAQHLGEAIRFKTISLQNAKETPRAPFVDLRRWLEATYPAFHRAAEREIVGGYSLLYTWQGTNPELAPILLMSHIDVVPIAPGTEDKWEQEPFSGLVADGFIWGRGAIDTKGSLVAMMEAGELLADRGFRPERTVMFAFGHDEEVGGLNGNVKIAELMASRGTRFHWIADEGGIVSEGIMPGIDGQVALVGIAEKGYVTLELIARAEGGHSSMPPKDTAIGRLARAIDRLQNDPFRGGVEGPVAQMLDAIAPNAPFSQRLVFANRWLFAPVIERLMSASPAGDAQLRTTIAPTLIEGGVKENVLPTGAAAKVNFRIHPRDRIEDVAAHVREAIDDPDIEVRTFNPGREASLVSSIDTDGFQNIAETIRDVFPGAVVAPNLVVGGTDSRHYMEVADNIYRFIPIILAREDMARFHGTNERITVENMGQAVQFYLRLIDRGTAAAEG